MSLVRFLGFTTLDLRVRRRPLSRSGDEPRGGLRRGEGRRRAWRMATAATTSLHSERQPRLRVPRARGARFVIRASQPPAPSRGLAMMGSPWRPVLYAHVSPSARDPPLLSRPIASTSPDAPGRLGRRHRHVAALQPRASGTAATRTRCRATGTCEWTTTWIAAAARVLRARRLAVPERRRQAERPVDGARRRAGGAAAPAAAEHHSLDQVDRDRPRRRPARRPG